MTISKIVHIYVDDARTVYVVPVARLPWGGWSESLPIEQVYMQTDGERATVVTELSRAIESAAMRSAQLMGTRDIVHWDGTPHRLHERNLHYITLEWADKNLLYCPQQLVVDASGPGWVDASCEAYPADITYAEIAERLVEDFEPPPSAGEEE